MTSEDFFQKHWVAQRHAVLRAAGVIGGAGSPATGMKPDRNIQLFGQRPIRFHLRVVGRHATILQTQFTDNAKSSGKKLFAEKTNVWQSKTGAREYASD